MNLTFWGQGLHISGVKCARRLKFGTLLLHVASVLIFRVQSPYLSF